MSSISGSITIPTSALKSKTIDKIFSKNRLVKSTYLVLKNHKFISSNYCFDIKCFQNMAKLLYV